MATKRGTNTDDNSLRGTRGADEFYGLGGNDKLWGLAGRDVLHGGAGNDELRGGDDRDLSVGGAGNNRLWGGAGDDVLSDDDGGILEGDAGNDVLISMVDGSFLKGGVGADILIGNNSKLVYWGSEGVTVNLAEGTAHGGFAAVYDSDGKVLRSDTFTSIKDLWGRRHDDVLEGRGGADRLFRGGGSNGGNDTASYAGSPGGVTR